MPDTIHNTFLSRRRFFRRAKGSTLLPESSTVHFQALFFPQSDSRNEKDFPEKKEARTPEIPSISHQILPAHFPEDLPRPEEAAPDMFPPEACFFQIQQEAEPAYQGQFHTR